MSVASSGPASVAALVLESRPAEYGACGMHMRHKAEASAVVAIAEAFFRAGYFLEMLTGEDWRAERQSMRLVYTYNRFGAPDRHAVFVELPGGIPGASAPSIARVIPAANWFEREVYDMYGIRFDGHPHLERLLLPEDADFHALLKDFGRLDQAPAEADE